MGVPPQSALFSASMWKSILGLSMAVILSTKSPASLPVVLLHSWRVQSKEAAETGTVLVLAKLSVASGVTKVGVGMVTSVNSNMLSKSSPVVPGRIHRR